MVTRGTHMSMLKTLKMKTLIMMSLSLIQDNIKATVIMAFQRKALEKKTSQAMSWMVQVM